MQEVFYTVIEWLFWIGIFIVFYTYLGYGILLYVLVKVKELFKKPISNDVFFIVCRNEEGNFRKRLRQSYAYGFFEEFFYFY